MLIYPEKLSVPISFAALSWKQIELNNNRPDSDSTAYNVC
jgi:hypothetical protein